MKKTSVGLALALALCCSLPVRAEEDLCASLGQIAETIMTLRQKGASLQSSLKTARKIGDEQSYPVFEQMVMDAYDVPFYSTAPMKERAVGEFRDSRQLVCMKVQRGK
jgi:hypothetical protein